ncbi:class F sortase [Streptomyces glaucus]|uniref:Class F sortase n=1 Tax=Streptomyces glaucus TaxID=284029 RepID=A0ABN3JJK4_9ACTN
MAALPSAPPSSADGDPAPPQQKSRTGTTLLWGAAALVLAMGLLGGEDRSPDSGRAPHAPPPVAAASPAAPGSPTARPAGKQLPRSRPTRLLIPKISVDAPFIRLGIGRSGELEAPPADDVNLVGWYAGGASPGEAGTSIIAGHVDTATSAAVFVDLHKLRKGDRFHVERADGRRASFVVDDVESFDKDRFPDERVYADTPQAQVRLITCAGDYDRAAKDYTENLVVFAHLV